MAGTSGFADGTGTAAGFHFPEGIAADGTNLYVADMRNHTIRQVALASGVVTTLAGSAGISGSADGTGTAASFNDPQGVSISGPNLYIADRANFTIRKMVIATGVVTTLAGNAGTSGSTDGTGSTARFGSPTSITSDGTNLYVTDAANNTIRQIVIATSVVTTLAGTAGTSGSTDGTGSTARFDNPQGITSDGTNLYVADTSNHTIRKVVIATGAVTTLAGTAGSSGSADGTSTAALFKFPMGIAADGANLYITDNNNHTIRKMVVPTGKVTTLAGTAGSSGSADGMGGAARFNYPMGITVAGTNLYVTDKDNHTIRKLQ